MTIEIHKPELEALINERLKSGAFENVEDVLMQALRGSAIPAAKETRTAAALVAAMQACPYEDVDFEPKRLRCRRVTSHSDHVVPRHKGENYLHEQFPG